MMLPQEKRQGLVSAAFFCPQARAPDQEYLAGMHSFLSQDTHGRMLLKEVMALKENRVWTIFAEARDDVAALSQGPQYIDMLHNWAAEGTCAPLATARSGIVALPLLLILQVTQYLRYLTHHGLSHKEFLESVRGSGGLQGYCGGLPSAMAIACAKDESEVVKYTATAMRIIVGIGAYGEAADDSNSTGSTTLALRLKYEGQGDDLTRRFPGTHVSAVTEPRSVSIVGPASQLHELYCFAREQEGLQVQKMEVRGKVHNPDNKELAKELCRLCSDNPRLLLPEAGQLQVQVRSNRTGQPLSQGSLAEELVTTILASRCEWYSLLSEVAKDLETSQSNTPTFVYFGLTDCVPLTPFHKRAIRATKVAAHGLIRKRTDGKSVVQTFPDDTLAVVGASCRLPGASNLEELWSMVAAGSDLHQKLDTDRFDIYGSFRASQSGTFTKDRTFYGNFLEDVRRFDNAFFGVNAREAANMDPQQRILLELAHEALEDAGYLATHRRDSGDNVGCFIGASFVEYLDNTNAHAPTAYTSTGTIRAFLCGRISYYYGWSGPAEVIDTACSSSLVAINRACKAVQSGECRMALTGGINIISGMNNYFDLAKAGFLSPTGQCKPFDASADGYCRSDGAGLVFIKKLKHAVADGDAILGVIPGIATNQGGLSASITVPHSAAQQALYRNVLDQAGLSPESVTYVETHGTGTQAGDPLEIESIRSVFSRKPSHPPESGMSSSRNTLYVGSIKGNIGHCETAAGVAGLLKVLAMIKHGQVPPQASHKQLNPKIKPLEPDGFAISRSLHSWDVPLRAALINSYGAAGSNCALLCCSFNETQLTRRKFGIGSTESFHVPIIPLLLSGASEKSLRDNARALGKYLRQQRSGDISLADVALTLNGRRQRFKYLASIEASDVSEAANNLTNPESLATFPTPVAPQKGSSMPVVLLFSGQYDNKVGLDRSFYNSFPAFRAHVDACDTALMAIGYSSMIPAIFETNPLDHDIVTLQCSIFAMQYASARCWLDAGLQPSAIVGHSLGELTALAVSGALSLPDAIKLVAVRASMIGAYVGPEKGAMLALSSCSTQAFAELRSKVKQILSNSTDVDLEIACYNGPNALVVAGTSAAVDAAEAVLNADAVFQKVRIRRLATSHGFHSSLMDPILEDLNYVAKSLTWNEPKIPLEVCAPKGLRSISEYSPSRHARDPVFFANSVQRLEKRLGGSGIVWLEAGIDTPVVPMASKATLQPDAHTFLPFKTKGSLEPPVNIVSRVLTRLWRSGIFPSHWSLLRECKPVWLPPYQFEATQHWLPNVDRAIEIQKQALATAKASSHEPLSARSLPPPPQLVTRRNGSSAASGGAEFSINTRCQRFRTVVSGHAVRSRALCPASMYMECVAMALQLHLDGSDSDLFRKGASLVFESLSISAPLGVEPEGEVVLNLDPSETSWKFSVRTLMSSGNPSPTSKPKETSHASGVIALTLSPVFDTFQRLVSEPIARIESRDNVDVERLMLKRAYSLFGRVVDYASFFKGIRSVALAAHEAVASIRLPGTEQPHRDDSTAWKVCDTVAVDAYIQVVGLLMNSDDSVGVDEVVVMVGLDRVVMSPGCKMDDPPEFWRVYARFGYGADNQPIGDVFVCNPDGALVAILSGCRFAKLPIPRLEKILDMANQNSPVSRKMSPSSKTATKPTTVPVLPSTSLTSASSSTTAESKGTTTPATSISSPITPSEDGSKALALREIISEYTGIKGSEIPEDTILTELGLDSLASVELVGELSSKFGIAISEDLGECTLRDLCRHLGAQSPADLAAVTEVPHATEPATTLGVPADTDDSDNRVSKFFQILSEVTGIKPEDIKPSDELTNLGVDSLSAIDLKQELEDNLSTRLDDIQVEETVRGLMAQLGISSEPKSSSSSIQHRSVKTKSPDGTSDAQTVDTVLLGNPFDVLSASDSHFSASAQKNGFVNYWSNVAPDQDQLVIEYVIEAFTTLGVDIAQASPGHRLPEVPHSSPKHDKVVRRLWEILKGHSIVSIDSAGNFSRGSRVLDPQRPSAAQLQAEFQEKHPDYRDEAALIGLTGPRLAQCLIGQLDAVSLMFGSAASMKIMENYYGQSPMISTLTDQLVIFISSLLKTTDKSRPVRILEVGAGTGGTTKRLGSALASAGVSVQYTFTDISPSLVSKAKNNTLKQYGSWMEFTAFNLEQEVPAALRSQFDIVIGTNCVHATSDQKASCRRLCETLVPGGIIVLSEVTRIIDWYDICFGLLDGWWLAEGGTAYPIRPANAWKSCFQAAGFASASWSGGLSKESTSQQLLVACNQHWETSLQNSNSEENHRSTARVGHTFDVPETVVYKNVDGLEIHADIYFPESPSPVPMPIALMIHGGGHMTLSRKAIRPAQTQYLLANGFLPVSIDYRLCPEVNLLDGPITDVRDAYRWARTSLPLLAEKRGITAESTKVVIVGWSSGGHLALSIGWTAEIGGIPPPTAILSFYAPYDFESGDLDSNRLASLPGRQMGLERIISALPKTPITTYDNSAQGDSTNLGWVRPGDPRSELVLALFKEGIGLRLLLNGLPAEIIKNHSSGAEDWAVLAPPSPERVASISPLAQVLGGNYRCPTFLVHGTADEVAPFSGAEVFAAALAEHGVSHGFLAVPGAAHIHDLQLRPGTQKWEEQVEPGYKFLFDSV
ncbi:hypothetical protein JX266_013235 [Neoarthrinium moseri]|nr:hypothetical protein JX266_013235 [Neoarthrinium moseri]